MKEFFCYQINLFQVQPWGRKKFKRNAYKISKSLPQSEVLTAPGLTLPPSNLTSPTQKDKHWKVLIRTSNFQQLCEFIIKFRKAHAYLRSTLVAQFISSRCPFRLGKAWEKVSNVIYLNQYLTLFSSFVVVACNVKVKRMKRDEATDTNTTPSKSLSIYKLFERKLFLTRRKLNEKREQKSSFRTFIFFRHGKEEKARKRKFNEKSFCFTKYAEDNKLKLTHK